MSRPISFLLAAAAATCVLTQLASAQADSESLDALKAEYEAEVQAAERELKLKYAAALERIQQDLQARAKLVGALAVKRERDKIEAELADGGGSTPTIPGTTPSPSGASEFVLEPENASPVGKVTFAENWDALTGWRGEGSGATWDLNSVSPGVYNVTIEYCCPVAGGTLKAKQSSAEFETSVGSTGGWDDYETRDIGQINISDPSQPISLIVTDDGGNPFGLINLRSVKLSRIGG